MQQNIFLYNTLRLWMMASNTEYKGCKDFGKYFKLVMYVFPTKDRFKPKQAYFPNCLFTYLLMGNNRCESKKQML